MNTIKFSILTCFFIICYQNLQAQEPCWFNTPPTCKDPKFVYAVGIGQDGDVVKMKNRAEAEALKMYVAETRGVQLEEATYKEIVENGLGKIRLDGRPVQYKVVRQGADNRRYDIFYTLLILPRSFSSDTRNIDYPNEGLCDGKTPTDRGGKIAIAIGSFSGYKSDQAENSATTAFTNDGRFIVSKAENSYRYGNNQQTSTTDVDYILSATSTCTQYERTEYLRFGNQSAPYKIPEVVSVVLTLTNAQTKQIIFNSTYNLNNIGRISGDIFPVTMRVIRVNGKTAELQHIDGGTFFKDEVLNVFEVNKDGSKRKIGKLKVGKSWGECKITDGANEIAQRFNSGAYLVVER